MNYFLLFVLSLALIATVPAQRCPTMSGGGRAGGFKIVTTTTLVDESGKMSYQFGGERDTSEEYGRGSYQSYQSGGDRDMIMNERPGGMMRGMLNENEISIIKSSWNNVKRRGGFAPKVFLRYLKAKPEAQKLFPTFSNVSLNDLSTNSDFLNRAYSCINSLNVILPHLNRSFASNCPALRDLKNKYNEADLKRFGSIWLTAMQEEMGNKFTNEVRDAWKSMIVAFNSYAST